MLRSFRNYDDTLHINILGVFDVDLAITFLTFQTRSTQQEYSQHQYLKYLILMLTLLWPFKLGQGQIALYVGYQLHCTKHQQGCSWTDSTKKMFIKDGRHKNSILLLWISQDTILWPNEDDDDNNGDDED